MKLLTKITFITILLIGCIFNAEAQKFQWVKGGGASSSTNQYAAYMCTDPHGNVYALNIIGGNAPITADTFHSSFYYGTNNIILITSYNCNGQMRWAKPIGSSDGVTPYGISSDSLGNVYIGAEYVHIHGPLYVGNDTTIAGGSYLAEGILQLDTSGHLNWIRFVGNNTSASFGSLPGYGSPLICDANNNAHYFVYAKSGVLIMTGVTSIYGVYDITYNTAGNMLSSVRLDLDSEWYLHGVIIDPVTNKLYVSGEVNMGMGAGVDTFFAAAFDASRHKLWQYFCGHGDDDGIGAITLDQFKHLHFCGNAQAVSGPTTFSFNGDSVVRVHYNGDMGIILTTDTNGHTLWIKNFDGSLNVNTLNGITQLPNGKVASTGTFAGVVINGYDSIVTPSGEGQIPYLVIVDSAGDLENIQQIYGDGFYDAGNVITSDIVGNVYVGGQSVDSIWAGIPPIPAFHSVGGATDFFVMKYGVDCSCTSMPIAAPFTDTGIHTIGFTYTGSTTGLDSVVWNFDDGSMDTGTTALHTYSVAGTYRPCVTIYTDCGSDMYCNNLVVLIPSLVVSTLYCNSKQNLSFCCRKIALPTTGKFGHLLKD
jgi:hypothetical protein